MSRVVLRLLTSLLLLATLVAAGCDLRPLPGGVQGPRFDGVSQTIPFITGQLVDGSGSPVEGATVRAYVAPYRIEGLSTETAASVETTTDARGAFRLESPPLGSVAVEARMRGQKALRTGVAVSTGASVEIGTLALQPTGRLAGKVVGASDLLGTDVFIPGTDYLAKAGADGSYLIQDVPAGTYQLAAVRSHFRPRVLDGVTVRAGETTTAPDLELSLDAPILQAMNPESGAPGTVVTLKGQNFGATGHTTFQVTFNDTLAVTSRRVSDTEIQVTVPLGATSGGVVVRSNGISSEPLTFQVIARLTLSPSSIGLFPGESYPLALQALNERGEPVPSPFVTWALRDSSFGTVSAQGIFQGQREGATELVARSGVLTASAWVGVSAFRMDTLYGNGEGIPAGDGGPATEASFGQPFNLAADAAGNVYVAEGSTTIVRRIAPDGTITRFAGNRTRLGDGDEGPAIQAGMGDFNKVVVGADNRLWISDLLHDVIRFIPLDDSQSPRYRAGYIYRAAGTGVGGYSGSGLLGAQTALNNPNGMHPGPDGLYFADSFNHRIRRLDAEGRVWDVLGTGAPGLVTAPVAAATANLAQPFDLARDAKGNWVIGCADQLVFWCRAAGTYFGRSMQADMIYPLLLVDANRPFGGDGPLEAVVLAGRYPHGFHLDREGGCWFVDQQLVRRITPDGRVRTLAGKAIEAANKRIFAYEGDGLNALACSFGEASDVLALGEFVLVADARYNRIRRLMLPGR